MSENTAAHRRLGAAFLAAVLLTLAGIAALAADPAGAREPAICQQYGGLPQCLPDEPDEPDDGDEDDDGDQSADPGDSGGDAGDDTAAGGFPGSGAAPPGGVAGADAGGELPFTGYPLTPLVWILIALLVCGLLVRAYLAIRERLRARSAPGTA